MLCYRELAETVAAEPDLEEKRAALDDARRREVALVGIHLSINFLKGAEGDSQWTNKGPSGDGAQNMSSSRLRK